MYDVGGREEDCEGVGATPIDFGFGVDDGGWVWDGVGDGATLGSLDFDGEEEDGCGGTTIGDCDFGACDGAEGNSGEFICLVLGDCIFGCDDCGFE